MGRRPLVKTDAAPAAEGTEAVKVVRRRRRRTIIDHAGQTSILVAALLKSRSGKGASQSSVIEIVEWARGVHEEDAALRTLKTRPRRLKAEVSAERIAKFDVNKALLDGVLAGQIGIDVDDNGGILFLTTAE